MNIEIIKLINCHAEFISASKDPEITAERDRQVQDDKTIFKYYLTG